MGVEAAGETPSLTGEFLAETNGVVEHTQAHSPMNQHHKGSIWLWVAGEVTENQQRVEQVGTVPSQTPPPHTASQRNDVGCPALVNT